MAETKRITEDRSVGRDVLNKAIPTLGKVKEFQEKEKQQENSHFTQNYLRIHFLLKFVLFFNSLYNSATRVLVFSTSLSHSFQFFTVSSRAGEER